MLKQNLSSILKHGGIYGLGRILSRGVGFMMIPVYTRYLDPVGYGILELLDLILSVMGLVIANGISSSIFRFYYKYDDPREKREVVSTAILSVMGLGALCGILVFALRDTIAIVLLGSVEYREFVTLALCAFVINLAGDIPMGYMRARQKSINYSAVVLSRLVLELSGNIWFIVHLGMGVKGILYTQIISATVFSAYLVAEALATTGIRFSREKAKALFRFGLPLIPSSIGVFIINYGDRFFLKHFDDLKEVGIYSLGFKFGYMLSYMVLQPFMLIWDAKMYEIAKQEGAERMYGRIFTYMVFCLAFVALGLSLYIDWIVRLMADESFWKAASIVPLLLVAYVFQGFYYFFQVGLYLKEKTRKVGGVILGTSFVTLALQYFLIKAFSSHGAAASTAVSFLIMSVLMYAVSQKEYRVEYEFRRVGIILATALSLYAVSRLVPEGLGGIAASTALLLSFPAALWGAGFFSPEEKGAFRRAISRIYGGAAAKVSREEGRI